MNSTRNTTIAAIFTLLLGTQLAWAQSAAADDIVVITDEDNPVTFTVLSESTSKGKGKGKKANQTPSDLSLVSITSPDHGTAIPNINDGTVTYTPDFDYFGPDAFSYTVSDGQETATGAIALTVNPVNDDPVAGNDEVWAVQSANITIDVLANDSDVDNPPSDLSIKNVRRASGVVHINADGTLLYNSTPRFSGDDVFTYTVIDGSGGSASGTVTVHVTLDEISNNDPVADDDEIATLEDTPVTINVLRNDSDPDGDPLTLDPDVVTAPSHGAAQISGDSSFTYTPDADYFGPDNFTYTVIDGRGGSATATVSISLTAVNDPPVITSPATANAVEDELFTYTATATDVDNAIVTFTFSDLSTWLAVDGDNMVTGSPTEGITSGSFHVTASDGDLIDEQDVIITVGAVNDDPVADAQSITTAEDSSVAITLTGSDPDEDALSFAVTDGPTHGALNGTAPNLTYIPAADFNGSDSFTFAVNDGHGGSATATVTIDVTPVNDAPVAVDDHFNTPEDTPLVLDVLANDTDVDGDPLLITNFRQANGILQITDDGQRLEYSPTPNFSGVDEFFYDISDGQGGTAEGTVTVLVAGVNDAPVAVNDEASTLEDTPVTINVLRNDSDPDGDPLTLDPDGVTQPGHGTVQIDGDSSFTYTPDADYFGPDNFTYTVIDGHGGSATATVSISLTAVNDPPVVTSLATVNAVEDEPFSYTATAEDVDGDDLSFTFAGYPAWLDASGATLTGTPGEGDGSATFTVTVTDNGDPSLSASLEVTVSVQAVNDAPVAADDAYSVDADGSLVVDAPGVLANDDDPVEGDALTAVLVSGPAHGSLSLNADGSFTYTPEDGFSGKDSFTYQANDGIDNSNVATVTLMVNVEDLVESDPIDPNAGGSFSAVFGGFEAAIDIPRDALDDSTIIQIGLFAQLPAGLPASVRLASPVYFFGPAGTTFNPPATVTIPYDPATPELDESRIVLLRYNEDDGTWDLITPSVNTDAHVISGLTDHFSGFAAGWTPNRAPFNILAIPGVSVDEDAAFVTLIDSLPEYFTDPDDGDVISFSVNELDEGLDTLFITQSLALIAIPGDNFFGDVRIEITATDPLGASVSVTFILTVTPVNDIPVFANIPVITLSEDEFAQVPLSSLASDIEGDSLSFTASSDTSALEAVVGETMLLLIPAPNWNGTANIALSVSDGQATQRDTFAVTVEAEPDIPSTFSLLEPDDNSIILITQDLLDDSLLFAWEPSTDPDGDPVTYLFTLSDGQDSFEYDDTSATEVRVPYADIIAAMKDKNLSIATFEWSVVAISKQDSVDAAHGIYRLTIDMSTLDVTGNSQLPQLFALHQNYPNPFNPVTTIRYELPAQTRVILVIYDLRGKEVVRLVDGYESAGYKKVVWNSSNAAGRPVPTGLYFARLVTSAYTHTIKLTLIK